MAGLSPRRTFLINEIDYGNETGEATPLFHAGAALVGCPAQCPSDGTDLGHADVVGCDWWVGVGFVAIAVADEVGCAIVD